MSSCVEKTITPTREDIELARESKRRLAKYAGKGHDVKAQVIPEGSHDKDESVVIPESLFRLLYDALSQMAQGNAVTMISVNAELTTQQAADLLNVSRPFLVELLEKGKIPHRKLGTHRRVPLAALMDYKQRAYAQQLKAIEELAAEAQEQDMGY